MACVHQTSSIQYEPKNNSVFKILCNEHHILAKTSIHFITEARYLIHYSCGRSLLNSWNIQFIFFLLSLAGCCICFTSTNVYFRFYHCIIINILNITSKLRAIVFLWSIVRVLLETNHREGFSGFGSNRFQWTKDYCQAFKLI